MIVFYCVQLCVQLCKTLCIIVSTIVFATVDASPVIANLFSVRRLELRGCGVWTTWQLMCGAVCSVSSVRITMCECPLCSMQCVVYAHHSVIITLQQHSALLSSAPTVSRDRNTGQCINCRGKGGLTEKKFQFSKLQTSYRSPRAIAAPLHLCLFDLK